MQACDRKTSVERFIIGIESNRDIFTCNMRGYCCKCSESSLGRQLHKYRPLTNRAAGTGSTKKAADER